MCVACCFTDLQHVVAMRLPVGAGHVLSCVPAEVRVEPVLHGLAALQAH